MSLTIKFQEYIRSFCDNHQLFNAQKKLVLALSGGLDSRALFDVLINFKDLNFEVVHFNHGTRKENEMEEAFIQKLCLQHNINLNVINWNLDLHASDFENMARLKRQKVYREYIDENYLVILGHHIDDSFEWSLMQKLRQGSLKSTLGIPLYSNGVIRPFMAVTKSQIAHYAKLQNLVWFEDSSNFDLRHDRNYLRQNIISLMKVRYPQYLKHYVLQHNQLAFDLKCHRKTALKNEFPIEIAAHFISGTVFKTQDFSFYREEILNYVKTMSDCDRGKLNIVFDQIERTAKKIKLDSRYNKFHGPYSFTGDVKAFLFNDRLWLTKTSGFLKLLEIEKRLAKEINNKTQITSDFVNQNGLKYFPNLMIQNKNSKKLKVSRLELPFLPETTKALKSADIPYSFVTLLS